jgi:peptidyl-prolyl cis-trans isomerase D
MKSAFASKMSYFVLTFIFLIIIASFLFSGFDKFTSGGAGKHVATVDGTPITTREYQTALSRQVEFFNQMMGGKAGGLTSKQLEEMGIKQSVLNGLIQQKLILNTADQLKFIVSLDEIKNEIKEMPYFKSQDRFDVNLYRNMLQSNGYVPTQFEELVGNDLKQKKLDELFRTTLVSENYVKDVLRFKNNSLVVTGVKIPRQGFSTLVMVSDKEITEFIKKAENQKTLEALYSENFVKYNKPAEIKARHILIKGSDDKSLEKIKALKAKVTPANFSDIANKETQDPTGNKNGGDLGWFSSGRMVPEFENVAFKLNKGEISEPVKTTFGYHLILVEDKKAAQNQPIDSVKPELAKEALQKTKGEELDKLLKTEGSRFQKLLSDNDIKNLESGVTKVNGQIFKDTEINQFDQNLAQATLSPQEAEQIFKATPGSVVDFSNPGTIFLIKVVSKKSNGDVDPEKLKSELSSQNQNLGRKIREELLREMNNKAKIVTNPALL